MDLFGTGDFPLLTVNISVVNSLNWFTFSSRLWTAVLPTLHNEDTQLSMCAWAADQASAQNPRIAMDDLFAQYCMLIITAFTPFFFFASSWDGEGLCVCIGDAIIAKEKAAYELKKKYFSPEGALVKLREQLIKPLQDKVWNSIKNLAVSNGISLVLDKSSGKIIYADPSIDISGAVTQQLGLE